MFRIIFVLDILNSNAVHAVRGERSRYRPIQSKVCDSSDPDEIISTLRPKEVYIADIDRLLHLGNNFEVIRRISSKTETMVDIGPEKISDIEKCIGIAGTTIVGTETASFELMEKAEKQFPGRINISIDIKNGSVLAKDKDVKTTPQQLVKLLNGYNIRDIIILDLDKVGTETGIDTDFLRDMVRLSRHNILLGGGIRDMNDINALKEIGVSGALVATAVHKGRIPLELIR